MPDARVRSLWTHRYSGIISRCYNEDCATYPNYGGRGIRMHGPWKRSRLRFLRYAKKLEGWDNPALDLDRKDNTKGYVPGNLRLVSRGENTRNRRNTLYVTFDNERIPLVSFWRENCPKWTYGAVMWHYNLGRDADWILARYRATRGRVRPA